MDESAQLAIASPDEVRAAILALTPHHLSMLGGYARKRVQSLSRRARGRDFEDLLHEALVATVNGNRPWDKSVSFSKHLFRSIRRISDGWARKMQTDEINFSQFTTALSPNGGHTRQEEDRLEDHFGSQPDQEEGIDGRSALQRIYSAFPRGTMERTIIDLWSDGYQQGDIVRFLNISLAAYKTAVHRIKNSNVIRMLRRMRGARHA